MNLQELSSEQMARYQSATESVMKEYDITSLGATYIAADNFPKVDALLLKGKKIPQKQKTLFARLAIKTEAAICRAFDNFFNACVGAEELHRYLQCFALNIKYFAQIFAQCDAPPFTEFFVETLRSPNLPENRPTNLQKFCNMLTAEQAAAICQLIDRADRANIN